MVKYAAIVLAGGSARRMGGGLKTLLPVGGRPMLHRVLAALSGAEPIIVVGPSELGPHLPAGVRLTREEPAGSGPVAAIAAGLELAGGAARIAVVAGDLPFLSRHALATLRQNAHALALYVDDEGRKQSMVAVWEGRGLRRALGPVPPGSMNELMARVDDVAEVAWTGADPPPWFDCDTPDELRQVERRLSGGERRE